MLNNDEKRIISRRNFLNASIAGLGVAAAGSPAFSRMKIKGANDRISLGIIGCGNRAKSWINTMQNYIHEENAEITALCDIWKVNLNEKVDMVKQLTGRTPKTFSRFEDLLTRKDIDGVIITTPDHIHCPALIAACRAGKDVFCEKPMAKTMSEANEALDTVKQTGSIVQIGTQRRSDGQHMAGAEFIASGALGTISKVDVGWNDAGPRWERDYSNVKREDVDWEGYLCNLPGRPFDARRFRCWHLYRDYSIGVVGLLGSHLTDVVAWFMDDPFPLSVTATGDTLVWKNREHMDTIQCVFKYPRGFHMSYETRLGNSSIRAEGIFYGTKGTFDTKTWTMTEEGKVQPDRLEGGQYPTSAITSNADSPSNKSSITVKPKRGGIDHLRNWLQCMRSRRQPNATIDDGYSHSVTAIMAHAAADTGKRQTFDSRNRVINEG